MALATVNAYCNPFSEAFAEARRDFSHLSTVQKIMTVVFTSLAAIATIYVGGIGGVIAFKVLVDRYKVQSKDLAVHKLEVLLNLSSKSANECLLDQLIELHHFAWHQKDASLQPKMDLLEQSIQVKMADVSIGEWKALHKGAGNNSRLEKLLLQVLPGLLESLSLKEVVHALPAVTPYNLVGVGNQIRLNPVEEAFVKAICKKFGKVEGEAFIRLLNEERADAGKFALFVYAILFEGSLVDAVELLEETAINWPDDLEKDVWLPKFLIGVLLKRELVYLDETTANINEKAILGSEESMPNILKAATLAARDALATRFAAVS